MIPGVPDSLVAHLWQSTLFAMLVWVSTLALRQNGARARYWLWVAASVKFLVPFSWLMALGAQFEWRSAPAMAQPAASFVIEQLLSPPTMDTAVPAVSQQSSMMLWMAAAIWVAGFAGVCLWWWRQWLPVRVAAHGAMALRLGPAYDTRGLTVMSSPSAFEPAVVGILRPMLLVPEGLLDHLTPVQMNALLAHERSHLRSHDNLMAAFHMAVEAIFWFHPLVWWIEGRLIDERERACDEAVLQSGNRPADYAEGILAVCRLNVRAPLACVAGVTGSDLRRRIETILRGGINRPISATTRLALTLTAVTSVGVPIAVGAVNAVPTITAGQDAPRSIGFEVASVKANRSGERAARLEDPPGGFEAINAPLRLLITRAYQISDNQLLNAPDWIQSERFDIMAKLASDPPAVPRSEPGARMLALRVLLAERFNLALKRDTREFPMYALVMARADRRPGPKLTSSSTDCSPEAVRARMAAAEAGKTMPGTCGTRFNTGRIRVGGLSMADFAKGFSYNGRNVIDRTGLKGTWNFDLTFTPDRTEPLPPGRDAPVVDPNGPSLEAALQEQLGLKLEPTKGLMEVLLVERVERPTEN